jgi:small neutral amino acid transporter SnatA (MarC family)
LPFAVCHLLFAICYLPFVTLEPGGCMSQTSKIVKFISGGALVVLAAATMLACAETPKPRPRPQSQETRAAVVPPPTPATEASPTSPPAIIAPDDGCVTCHTNQETLIATAKEEEAGEVLSEGEG